MCLCFLNADGEVRLDTGMTRPACLKVNEGNDTLPLLLLLIDENFCAAISPSVVILCSVLSNLSSFGMICRLLWDDLTGGNTFNGVLALFVFKRRLLARPLEGESSIFALVTPVMFSVNMSFENNFPIASKLILQRKC
jgi:hypothetical protein